MNTIPLLTESQLAREQLRAQSENPEIWDLLETVKDPEIPVVSIWDLGILQDVTRTADGVEVLITPTYSGCPAMTEIEADIRSTLQKAGYANVTVKNRLSPPWTTDWMTAAGRERLREYGIAPPMGASAERGADEPGPGTPACPLCSSPETVRISEYGSTACKALYRCESCLEPFDYFKCL